MPIIILFAIFFGTYTTEFIISGKHLSLNIIDFLIPLLVIVLFARRKSVVLPIKEVLLITAMCFFWIISLLISPDPLRGAWIVKIVIISFLARLVMLNSSSFRRQTLLYFSLCLFPILIFSVGLLTALFKGITLSQMINARKFYVPGVGKTNTLGTYLAAFAPILLGISISTKNKPLRIFAWLGVVSSIGGIVLASSRGAALSFIFGLLVFLIFSFRRISFRSLLSVFLPTILISVLILSSNLSSMLFLRFQEVVQGGLAALTVSVRLDDWRVAWLMFKNSPLIGQGLGSFESFYKQFGYFVYLDIPRNPHNVLLYLLAEVGILGTIPFIWWISMLLTKSFHAAFISRQTALGIGIVTGALIVIVNSMWEPTILSQSGTLFLFYLLTINEFMHTREEVKISNSL